MFNDEYYIWGAGVFGARIIEFMKNELRIKAVIDNDPIKQGELFHGKTIINYSEAKGNLPEVKIVLAMNNASEILDFLRAEGYIENRDYFSLNSFMPRYFWAKNKSLVFRSACFAVTTVCNMNCEGCSVFMPIRKNHKHISTESIITDLDLLFSHADSVMALNITCGESLLNKETSEICMRINERYSNRYHSLIVQTNGNVIPSDNDMRQFASSNTILATSNYPENAESTERLIEKCREFSVRWYYNRGGGNRDSWSNLGDPRHVNETSPAELRTRYSRCRIPGMGLYDGRLYICMIQTWSHLVVGAGTLDLGDAFDLRKQKSDATREELYKMLIQEPPESGYISHCMRCNGTNMRMREQKHAEK
jgi:hypothetical protein